MCVCVCMFCRVTIIMSEVFIVYLYGTTWFVLSSSFNLCMQAEQSLIIALIGYQRRRKSEVLWCDGCNNCTFDFICYLWVLTRSGSEFIIILWKWRVMMYTNDPGEKKVTVLDERKYLFKILINVFPVSGHWTHTLKTTLLRHL